MSTVNVKCLNCGVDFPKSPSQIKKSPNHYCSKTCAATRNNTMRTRQLKNKCLTCQQPILASLKYCSRDCRLKGTSIQYHTTLGEYRKLYHKLNFNINLRKQARHEYTASGRPFICFACGYSHTVDVCHMKSIANFSDDTLLKDINHIDNLVTLCPNHHWELDNGFFKPCPPDSRFFIPMSKEYYDALINAKAKF